MFIPSHPVYPPNFNRLLAEFLQDGFVMEVFGKDIRDTNGIVSPYRKNEVYVHDFLAFLNGFLLSLTGSIPPNKNVKIRVAIPSSGVWYINVYLFKVHPTEVKKEPYTLFGSGYIAVEKEIAIPEKGGLCLAKITIPEQEFWKIKITEQMIDFITPKKWIPAPLQGFVSDVDPGALGKNRIWIDTSYDRPVLKIRNKENTGWNVIKGFEPDHLERVESNIESIKQNITFLTAKVKGFDLIFELKRQIEDLINLYEQFKIKFESIYEKIKNLATLKEKADFLSYELTYTIFPSLEDLSQRISVLKAAIYEEISFLRRDVSRIENSVDLLYKYFVEIQQNILVITEEKWKTIEEILSEKIMRLLDRIGFLEKALFERIIEIINKFPETVKINAEKINFTGVKVILNSGVLVIAPKSVGVIHLGPKTVKDTIITLIPEIISKPGAILSASEIPYLQSRFEEPPSPDPASFHFVYVVNPSLEYVKIFYSFI